MSTPKRRKSQTKLILAFLKQGKTITPFVALQQFHCMRLSERIRELEAEGVQIERKWVTEIDARYMSYTLQVEAPAQKVA